MSNSKDKRLLIIAESGKGEKLSGSALLKEAREFALHPQVEWLFFYGANMGIITEQYESRLITGYPLLALGKTNKPFSDRISQQLFADFFSRFLFAKKIRIILLTTPTGFEIINKFAEKNRMKLVFYQDIFSANRLKNLHRLKNFELYYREADAAEINKLSWLKKITSFEALIEMLLGELARQ